MMVIEISIISPSTSCTHLQNTRHLVYMKHDLLSFSFAMDAYMPTLPDYPGVSRIRHQFPVLPYGSLYLPDNIIF